ncbi:hypothetical protein SAMN02799620_00629 [Mycolicibacterium fluoranthenivorans]|uniref:Protein kinase domain-containing protein n=2 Tax=Mycolicibacterium fluoranthenivorans TaxID=258505 RepID=A0A1G4VAI6_9MYCO|nr:hypothetical protein SAMN02799620_00629 [Mycolicibacterium fluoranthenivorans]
MGEPDRLASRDTIAAKLSALSDDAIRRLLDAGTRPRVGIGGATRSVRVAGMPVFVKAIRLSDRELDAGPGNTSNLFGLPPWYHYGVGEGSAGFNAWREVATHEMVSDWIIEDGYGRFPLLYHWRILPGVDRREADEADIVRAVDFWAGSTEVEARLRALSTATAAVVLFMEYVPWVLRDWIDSKWDCGAMDVAVSAQDVVAQLLGVTQRMRARGLVHFDVHLDNILTTGQNLIVSDFGLAAAAHFQLDDAERRFLATHVDHDVAYCAAELTNAILGKTMAFPHARARNAWLRDLPRADTLGEGSGPLSDIVRRLAPTAALINDHYWHLHGGHLETPFPSRALAAALDAMA